MRHMEQDCWEAAGSAKTKAHSPHHHEGQSLQCGQGRESQLSE